MSTPSNPIIRGITAFATGGLSEAPAQFKGATKAATNAISGQNPLDGLTAYAQGGSPIDAPKITSPLVSPVTTPRMMPSAFLPGATLRKRRNFSTLLTGSQGDTSDTQVKKQTLLGGQGSTLGG